MNKIIRIGATVLLAIGLFFLLYYVFGSPVDKFYALQHPSYFRERNLQLFFFAAAAATGAAVISGFFAYLKSMDTPDQAIANPVAMDREGIDTIIGSSTLNTGGMTNAETETKHDPADMEETQMLTEVLRDEE